MENKIPVPTDNIFKFYALFGLLLLVFSMGAIIYVTRASNELIYSTVPELAGLKEIEKPNEVTRARIAVLEKKLEINKTDKTVLPATLTGLCIVAAIAMAYGFVKWHCDIQPMLDETACTQLQIAKLQLAKLRREIGTENVLSAAIKSETNHSSVAKLT
jgi:hypothetical protein